MYILSHINILRVIMLSSYSTVDILTVNNNVSIIKNLWQDILDVF